MKLSKKQFAIAIKMFAEAIAVIAVAVYIGWWISKHNPYNATFFVYAVILTALTIIIARLHKKKKNEQAEMLMLLFHICNFAVVALAVALKLLGKPSSDFLAAVSQAATLYLLAQPVINSYQKVMK